jgi:hypothetical protein
MIVKPGNVLHLGNDIYWEITIVYNNLDNFPSPEQAEIILVRNKNCELPTGNRLNH